MVTRPRKRQAEETIPRGFVRIEHGFLGTSPEIRFRALLVDIKNAEANGAPLVLDGNVLADAKLALKTALWAEEEIKPRDLHAFAAFSIEGSDNERVRIFANRMRGRPDRAQGGRGATYRPDALVQQYRVLTGHLPEPDSEPRRLIPRGRYGLPARGSTELPLSSREALIVLTRDWHFPNESACFERLKKAVLTLPSDQRPKLPPRWEKI
jgi:hypothetical protein